MSKLYRHTQIGRTLHWVTVAPAVGLVFVGLIAGRELLLLPLTAIHCGLRWTFSLLTVEVSARELTWFFGPGLWRNRLARGNSQRHAVRQQMEGDGESILRQGAGFTASPASRLSKSS